MAAPTLADYQDVFSTTGTVRTTPSITWANGALITVLGITDENIVTLTTPTATGLTFTAISGFPTAVASNTKIYAWQATAGSASSGTVSSTASTTGNYTGIAAFVWTGHNGVGNTGTATDDTTDPYQASLTRAGNNSAVISAHGDWNAINDIVVTTTPAGASQREASTVTGQGTFFVFYWPDEGAAGTTSYGFTGLAGGKVSSGVVEIQGSAGAAPVGNRLRRWQY